MASSYGASEDTAPIGGITLVDMDLASLARPAPHFSRRSVENLGYRRVRSTFPHHRVHTGVIRIEILCDSAGGTSSSAVTHIKRTEEHGYDDEYFELPDDLEAAIAELIIDDDLIASSSRTRTKSSPVESRSKAQQTKGSKPTKGGQNATAASRCSKNAGGGGYQH